jgi:squalene-hopene/tetraprenyl-beta-curcumene cyclase
MANLLAGISSEISRRFVETFDSWLRGGYPDVDELLLNTEKVARRKQKSATSPALPLEAVESSVYKAREKLLRLRNREKGYWVGLLEANVTLCAEYIMLMHYIDRVDEKKQRKIIKYLQKSQQPEGGWPLYYGGPGDISAAIEVYFASKLAGISPDEPFMKKARAFIMERGGVMAGRVMTKMLLGFFGQFDWEGVPSMPVQLMFFPVYAPLNIYDMSYWARTYIVPLLVLVNKKVTWEVPPHGRIDELYPVPRDQVDFTIRGNAPPLSLKNFFLKADNMLKLLENNSIKFQEEEAIRKAELWILDHQDDSGDWGGIFPAMMNSIMALYVLGYSHDHPVIQKGLQALERLEVDEGDTLWVQPCVSPVWDTAWAVRALCESGMKPTEEPIRKATDWLYSMQIERPGDWSIKAPKARPGGWAFQFYNDYYPDIDDSAVVLQALLYSDYAPDSEKVRRLRLGYEWLLGLQNEDGGFAAFEKDGDNRIFNEIIFNDAKNMLDPSTADVTGRVLEALGAIGYPEDHPVIRRILDYLLAEQEEDGSWWGRWGVNFVYGTWSVLTGLERIGCTGEEPFVKRATNWLKKTQNPDGGWGESCYSYDDPETAGEGVNSASQTAWGLMGLIAAGEGHSDSAKWAAKYLIDTQKEDGGWEELEFTGTGFPRAFYLRYYLYCLYFPLLALSRYRALYSR